MNHIIKYYSSTLSRDRSASFWYALPCPSLSVETKSVLSSDNSVASLVSVLLVLNIPLKKESRILQF